MRRQTAFVAGFLAWVIAMFFVPDGGFRAFVVWALLVAVAVTVSIVSARLLSRELRKAVLKDHS